jgi:hypothetical protein
MVASVSAQAPPTLPADESRLSGCRAAGCRFAGAKRVHDAEVMPLAGMREHW